MDYKKMIAKNFSRCAKTYDKAAVLQQEIGKRLIHRLELIKISPATILDLGSGTGFFSKALSQQYPQATLLNVDIAEGMLRYANQPFSISADAEYLPLKNNSVDFIFSNCMLQWSFNPQDILKEVHRVLKPEGLFLFSTFGPDTLKELKQSFSAFDSRSHVNLFMDMHDMGDLLLQADFTDPVMDMEYFTLTYKTVLGLVQDLRQTGSNIQYPTPNISKTFNPKSFRQKLIEHYEALRSVDNRLPATFEVIYGHAFGSAHRNLYRADEEGVISIPADSLEVL
jgi:malonyl-CoA O-methyltransferase